MDPDPPPPALLDPRIQYFKCENITPNFDEDATSCVLLTAQGVVFVVFRDETLGVGVGGGDGMNAVSELQTFGIFVPNCLPL